jgi:hypothetical protein
MWPSLSDNKVGILDWFFGAQSPARRFLCLRFAAYLAIRDAKLEVKMVRYSFLVGLFHLRPYAGCSRRSARHRILPDSGAGFCEAPDLL